MLHAGLDLSRRRLDVCLISGEGEVWSAEFAVSPDVGWAARSGAATPGPSRSAA